MDEYGHGASILALRHSTWLSLAPSVVPMIEPGQRFAHVFVM